MRKDGKEQERERGSEVEQMNLESPNRVHRHRTWLVHHHKILIHVEDLNWISEHLQVTILFLTRHIIACFYRNTC